MLIHWPEEEAVYPAGFRPFFRSYCLFQEALQRRGKLVCCEVAVEVRTFFSALVDDKDRHTVIDFFLLRHDVDVVAGPDR